ncbi:MAG: DUF4097 domain-containing protein [Candidatus Hydrogenedentes bacterium]|nr:DUF4097 domain-containing protein [Candidatus Hydrogenedentota bacterium]
MKRLIHGAALVCAAAWAAPADTAIDETRAAGPNDHIEILNVSGSVDVQGWDRNEVRVTGTLGRNVEKFAFDRKDDETLIKVIIPKGARNVGSTSIVVRAPAGNVVHVESVSGSIEVRDMRADLELNTTSGSVRVTNCAGDVQAESLSGSVHLDGDFGEVEALSKSGSVKVRTVRDEVRASSLSGSIEVEAVAPKRVECESMSGSVSYTGGLAPDAKLEASTQSGSVKLRLPADVSARVRAETFSGGIKNEINGAQPDRPQYGPGESLNAKFGDGSASIDASAFSGSVSLLKK